MPEVGLTSGFRARDISPDSVIFTSESTFSLFSSASASVDRCSFASDVPDQESVSQPLAGCELSQVISGPDPDLNISLPVHKNNICFSRKEKAKVQMLDSSEAETTEDENVALDYARNSFTQALKECQDRRLRSEVLLKKAERRKPASLDLNIPVANAVSSTSPRFGAMKKTSTEARRTGPFLSPGTPNYRHTSVGIHKGWSSERVPLRTNTIKRNVSTALLPYNNGRTLPSKWEDAERWILSPMSGDGFTRTSHQQPQRRPKSKSGPLGLPGVAYYQMFSPATPMFERGRADKLTANSRFSSGVMGVDGLSVQFGGSEGTRNFLTGTEPCMARSISIHGCSEMISQQSLSGHHDVKYQATEDAANNISRAVSRRDMATQMSSDSSNHSSPRRDTSFSLATPTILPIVELHNMHSSKPEMQDAPVDERVTVARWSKMNRGKNQGRVSRNADDWKRRAVNYRSASWEVSSEASKSISTIQREDAKITAWENLQKAKAEAAIRKLEMKLEKKRSSSMDKIINKLKSAQKKAQKMRNSMMANQGISNQMARPSERSLSFRRAKPIRSLSGCFTCHAFWV